MVWGNWYSYTQGIISLDRDNFGVYELGDVNKSTVYYGSGQVRTRLLDHLNKKECPMTRYYRIEYCQTEAECRKREEQLLQAYKNAHGKLPMYNERIG